MRCLTDIRAVELNGLQLDNSRNYYIEGKPFGLLLIKPYYILKILEEVNDRRYNM